MTALGALALLSVYVQRNKRVKTSTHLLGIDTEAESIPSNLYKAIAALESSSMFKEAFGQAVVKHYVRCGEVEIEAFERVVTDWEVQRGFERV